MSGRVAAALSMLWKNRRRVARVAVLVSLLAAALWGPHVVWRFLSAKTLTIVIVDKTVPFRMYREHAALTT